MANSFTNKGQEYMLHGTATPNGALSNLGTKLKLYDNTSTPAKDGTGFVEVANGNGYVTGGIAITRADYTLSLDTGNQKIVIANKVFTASGGSISNIAGAYLTDAANAPLAWWERTSSITIGAGDTLTLDTLTLKIT